MERKNNVKRHQYWKSHLIQFCYEMDMMTKVNDKKLTVNSILYKTGNLRRCSQSLMKKFNSVGASGIVCDSGLFSSEMVQTFIVQFLCVITHKKREDEKGKIIYIFFVRLTLNRQFDLI
jgi:hypothetical protein